MGSARVDNFYSGSFVKSFVVFTVKMSLAGCFVQTCDQTITGRNFEYDRALEIIEEEEYLEDVDFDDIRRLRRADVNYFEIYKKIGSFDKSVNVPKSEQKIDNWNIQAVKTLLTPRILKKKTGKAVPITNDRPNYR